MPPNAATIASGGIALVCAAHRSMTPTIYANGEEIRSWRILKEFDLKSDCLVAWPRRKRKYRSCLSGGSDEIWDAFCFYLLDMYGVRQYE